jgi:hypothetical protein
MAITVKHKFVSAIPDGADATIVRPSNWNDDHDLTGTIPVANGGTGASTLTGYVVGNGTSAFTASSTIPSGDITGLGTMSTQNANAVAITGGSINGTTIGATTASTGAFTYFSTSSTTNTTPVLSYNASNCNFAVGATVSGSYLQAVMQNKSATATASTNWAVSNDLGTDSSYYGEFGMNSSVYSSGTPADFFSLNNGIYFSGHDGDMSIGSGNGFKTYLAWGTTGDKAHVINASGAIGLNTNITGTTNFGTSGQVLTSAGSAATPTWATNIAGNAANVTGIVAGANGGTGVANTGFTFTMAGNVSHAGAFTQTFTATGNTFVTLPTSGTLATLAGTETFTNKRITPRVSTTTSSATPTINTDNTDQYGLTAQAVDITSFTTNLSGTPTDGQKLWIYIVGTAARAITWGASFESSTATLPSTTVSTNRLDIGFVWNTATTKWRCVAVA